MSQNDRKNSSDSDLSERYSGLDFLRSTLMLIGVFYHCAAAYEPNLSWRVAYHEQSSILAAFNILNRAFRMETFFVLSGFFFGLLICRYDMAKTIRNRTTRILIPMFFVGFTLNTYMNFLSPQGLNVSLSYVMSGKWLGHLWFLGSLIVYYVLMVPFGSLLKKKVSLRPITFFVIALFATPLASAALLEISRPYFVKDLRTILFFIPVLTAKHLPYFLLGTILWRSRESLLKFLSIPTALFMLGCVLALQLGQHYFQPGQESDIGFGLLMIHRMKASCLALFIMSLTQSFGKPSRIVSHLTDASYTIYLLHMPLIVFSFPLIVWAGLPPIPSFILHSMGIALACWSFHHFGVRKFNTLSWLLNGKSLASRRTSFAPSLKPSSMTATAAASQEAVSS